MHQHPAARVQAILDELVARLEVLEQILIVYIIDFYDMMRVSLEELLVERQLQHGENVRDPCGLQCGFGA
jgi:hypothetical protein